MSQTLGFRTAKATCDVSTVFVDVPVVRPQLRSFGTMDVRGCAATTGFRRFFGWLGHNRVGSIGNDDDYVLQPPCPHQAQGGRWDNHHRECDFGVLVSKSEFVPFRRRENGSNSNLDVNIECGGCVTETVGGRKGDVTAEVTVETAKTVTGCETTYLADCATHGRELALTWG